MFQVGTKVRIIAGNLKGYTGEIIEVDTNSKWPYEVKLNLVDDTTYLADRICGGSVPYANDELELEVS